VNAIIFADLDDTLFQSRRKCPVDEAPEALVPLGFRADGTAAGFATSRQMSFLAWIAAGACLVPVTARSRESLSRVRLSWDFAVCAHGGVIVENGRRDEAWHRQVMQGAERAKPVLDRLRLLLERAGGQGLSVRLVEEGGAALYLLAKHRLSDVEALHSAAGNVAEQVPAGWSLHINDNHVSIVPPFLGKRRAVERLLPRLRALYPDATTIGIGDSVADAGFMSICDLAMVPRGSQLAGHLLALVS
jgi:hydroxymethylpyrimidine pyrophosphatase-like HAD family hydrolase